MADKSLHLGPSAFKVAASTLAVLVGIVAAVVAVRRLYEFVLVTLLLNSGSFPHPSVAPTETVAVPFDQAGWASGDATQRHAMAKRMTDSRELIGETRDELIRRFGTPAKEGDDWGAGDRWSEWSLGERRSPVALLGNYREFLRVVFDKCGNVDQAYIWDYD